MQVIMAQVWIRNPLQGILSASNPWPRHISGMTIGIAAMIAVWGILPPMVKLLRTTM